LEVRGVDAIAVHDPNRPDPGGGKVLDDGRTESACADDQHTSFTNSDLTFRAEPVEPYVPVVTIHGLTVDLNHRATLGAPTADSSGE
jgi:hypothetical protein